MKIKITFILVFLFVLFGFKTAYAEVIINEVMYNPTDGSGHEWIEIYNNGNEQVNLDGWRFFNSESSSAPLRTSSSFILEPNSYALITGSNSLVSFSGQIFTSSQFSLPNDSSKYGTYKGVYSDANKTTGNSITYDTGLGANGDGNSLQLVNGTWIAATPTLGIVNQSSSNDNNDNNENPGSNTTTTTVSGNGNILTKTVEPKQKVIENPTMKAKILANNLAFSGEPFGMQANILGYSNEKVVLGKAYWNFGDGSSFEQINNFEKFYHTYYYPGEYILSFEYYLYSFSQNPEVTSKMTIKVLPTTVVISKIGDTKDFFIELTNNATSDMDISNWTIRAGGKTFLLPRNSMIMSKNKMTISGKITGFTYGDQYNLKLFSGTGELVFDYNNKYIPVRNFSSQNKQIQTVSTNNSTATVAYASENPVSDLEASPALSDTNNKNPNKSYFFFWGFVVLLFVSGGGVYYLRQRKNVSKVGDDFKIIDE